MASSENRARAIAIVVAGTVIGGVVIASQSWVRAVVRQWLVADPEATASRARLLLAGMGAMLVVPLLGFAFYMWTRTGEAAQRRMLRALAGFLVASAVGLAVMLWRLAALLAR